MHYMSIYEYILYSYNDIILYSLWNIFYCVRYSKVNNILTMINKLETNEYLIMFVRVN